MTKIRGINRPPDIEREKHDFYATSSAAIAPLLTVLGWQSPKVVWENSCGQGHLSRPLTEAGHNVISTDLIDRGFGIWGVDFLKPSVFDGIPFDAVIMNPPYKHARKFVEKSLIVAPTVCAFLRLQFLESKRRATFFDKNPPRFVCVFRDRIACSKDGLFPEDEKSATCYAWFVWERGFSGQPIIKWI